MLNDALSLATVEWLHKDVPVGPHKPLPLSQDPDLLEQVLLGREGKDAGHGRRMAGEDGGPLGLTGAARRRVVKSTPKLEYSALERRNFSSVLF